MRLKPGSVLDWVLAILLLVVLFAGIDAFLVLMEPMGVGFWRYVFVVIAVALAIWLVGRIRKR